MAHAHPHPEFEPSNLAEDPALDPANRELASALRKSFSVLKLVMLVLVVLYVLSGLFSVKPDEVGLILRCGRIAGVGSGDNQAAVLGPGWHWSWPYPIDRWVTVSNREREIPIDFMFQLSDEEKVSGIKGYKANNLSPERDDYLITGDVNILHASLVLKYKITDPVAYLTFVKPAPAAPGPEKALRPPPYKLYPEFTLLTDLTRNAVIETAARRQALEIRGNQQEEFLHAVAAKLIDKLMTLDKEGTPLGITVDPNNGILAPKSSTIEAILPPRQTQEIFDRVSAAQEAKGSVIARARSEAQSMVFRAAGPNYAEVAEAIDAEFDLMLKVSAAETTNDPSTVQIGKQLETQRARVEQLLLAASGDVQSILKNAEVSRDGILKEASGDYDQFVALLPLYLREPDIFMSRLRDEAFANALKSDKISKTFISKVGGRIWLQIPKGSKSFGEDKNQNRPPSSMMPLGTFAQPEIK